MRGSVNVVRSSGVIEIPPPEGVDEDMSEDVASPADVAVPAGVGVESGVAVGVVVSVGVAVCVAVSVARPAVVVDGCGVGDAVSVLSSPVSALHPAKREKPAAKPQSRRRRDERVVSSSRFRPVCPAAGAAALSSFSMRRCVGGQLLSYRSDGFVRVKC